MTFTQDGRFLIVSTPLGKDSFLLRSFLGREAVSAPFEFDLDLLAEKVIRDVGSLVGKAVSFAIQPQHGDPREFSGIVRRIVFTGFASEDVASYRAELVPWFWLLTKRSDHRIFQEMTVTQICEQVFQDAGFDAFDVSGITGSYPKREYCVQMGETDFDFVSRLLEESGIFYSFRFESGRHVMVLADSTAAYAEAATPELEFTSSEPSTEQVSSWEHGYEFVSGRWGHADFDFEAPTTRLLSQSDTVVSIPSAGAFERFEYPGRYHARADGDELAKVRMEAEECRHDVVSGVGGCFRIGLATRFKFVAPRIASDDGQSFVMTSIEHSARDGSFLQSGGGTGYSNRFRCIPASVPFRPERRTERPRVSGPQTAIVVGPAGEEIHTDKYGRIKVQFHWDRRGKYDDKSSCWMRVVQGVAGKKWGWQVLPRVGQEVVVEFLDGDPDRPLVTGAVYNANTMPAFELPANKTQSGFRSRATKKGAADAINEIRFEDLKGKEHIYIRAQKDEHHDVVECRFDQVGKDSHRKVVGNAFEETGGDVHETIGGDRLVDVAGAHEESVAGDRSRKVGGTEGVDVGGDQVTKLGGNHELNVAQASKVKAGMDLHVQSGKNANLKAGMNLAAEGGMNVHVKGGMNVVIEAGMQLTLKAGAGFVVIGPAGVDISGPMVKVNSGGAAGSGSGCSPQAPGTPAAPGKPKPPDPPLDKIASADADAYQAGQPGADKMTLKWTSIEASRDTAQAAAMQAASDTGAPFCESCG